MRCVYVDNSATTPVRKEVLEKMLPYFSEGYGNPSSLYKIGQAAKTAIEDAREKVAKALGAEASEIYFTGCGTESDNWAIKGISKAYEDKGKHIITSAIEHHAVIHTLEHLEKMGYEVTCLPVDEYGMVNPDDLCSAIRPDTVLVTIMFANNEVGTIQPIEELVAIAKEHGVIFHTDAVQAIGHIDVDVKKMGIDLLSLSAHKFGGPKGVGALYCRKGLKIHSMIQGGAQERGKRAGTENVAGIVGLGAAIDLVLNEREEEITRISTLRDNLIEKIQEKIPYCKLNGHPIKRLPNNVNFSFRYIEGESLLLMLDMKGIAASSGSACSSGSLDPSHVLLAMGLTHEIAHGSLRLSLGRETTQADVEYIVQELAPIVEKLRAMSPLYDGVR